MSGIAGIIGRTGAQNAELLVNMLAAMNSQSGDERSCYNDDKLGCAFGLISPSHSLGAGSIFWNEDNDISVIFSGELFPEPHEIQKLRASGHKFTPGDASYLPHLYEEMQASFFSRLNGRFCGCLLDLRRNQITLFNDRYGLGRIYFVETNAGFFFASEAKALLRALPHTRELDERGIAELCSCGCVLQNRTVFKGIHLVPGAAKWVFAPDGDLQKQTYFARSEWENQPVLGEEAYYEKLKSTFVEVLPRYLNGSQPVGMSLTGGLDGRMIMAWAKCEPGQLPCYTFGGSYRESRDVMLAREVARTCEQPHSVISVQEDFLAKFPLLAAETIRISDGTLDVTGAAEAYVNEQAKAIAPVRVTGSYGSEVLRGNVAFKSQPFSRQLYSDDIVRFADEVADTYRAERAIRTASFIAFKQVPWHHYGRLSVEQSKLTIRTPFLDNALVALAYQAPPSLHGSPDPSLRLIAEGNPSLGKIPTDRGLTYASCWRAKARSCLEQFSFKAEYVYDYGMPQWLARIDHRLARLRLDRMFLGRHKFHHFRVWYRDKLASYVRDVLLDPVARNRSYVSQSGSKRIVEGHLKQGLNYTTEITQLLTLELIHRELLQTN